MELCNQFRDTVPAEGHPSGQVERPQVERPQVEPVDILPIIARSVIKRVLPVVGALGAVVVVRTWRRRHR